MVGNDALPIGRASSREAIIPDGSSTQGTRAELLHAARRLFAERGFYGASIAAIAEELGLTKQALLHHFGSKERLYREVLSQMAEPLTGMVERARAGGDPKRQIEDVFAGLHASLFAHPQDAQLLMRELLDNPGRAVTAHSWPMKAFLAALTAMARKAAGPSLSETEALTRIYLLLGAMKYFAVSEPTLRHMYGEAEFAAMKDEAAAEVRRMARAAFA